MSVLKQIQSQKCHSNAYKHYFINFYCTINFASHTSSSRNIMIVSQTAPKALQKPALPLPVLANLYRIYRTLIKCLTIIDLRKEQSTLVLASLWLAISLSVHSKINFFLFKLRQFKKLQYLQVTGKILIVNIIHIIFWRKCNKSIPRPDASS